MAALESTPWYEQWFDEDYLALYSHRNESEARKFIHTLWTTLELRSGMRVADVPCGAGRHSIALAHRGARVVGVDLSAAMLQRAVHDSQQIINNLLFVRGDLRRIPLTVAFHLVVNIFSSIGYFLEEEENRAGLAELARILLPGGLLALDVINPAFLRANFVARTDRETPSGRVMELRTLDDAARRVTKRIEIASGGRARVIRESVRLYERSELEHMAAQTALQPVDFWGDYDGSKFQSASPRLIMIARKA